MPFTMIRQDIVKMEVDAIVNCTDTEYSAGGGVDLAIRQGAGEEYANACEKLPSCRKGEVRLTKGYKLPARYIIHTVGPSRTDPDFRQILTACYQNALALAKEKGLESIAFPLLSSGFFGVPKKLAFHVARKAILDFLAKEDSELDVYLAVYDKESLLVSEKLYHGIREYITDQETENSPYLARERRTALDPLGLDNWDANYCRVAQEKRKAPRKKLFRDHSTCEMPVTEEYNLCLDDDLTAFLGKIDLSFSQKLLKLIDEKGMTDVACYKKANIDRKLFSKIRSDIRYRPTKQTAVAFALALELTLPETQAFLASAGYVLSESSQFDLIVMYCILRRIYNVYDINEILFAYDQMLLGGVSK